MAYGSEADGYATYTYVLVGRSRLDEVAASKYQTLLDAVMSSTPWLTESPHLTTEEASRQLNLFLLPARTDPETSDVVSDFELSKGILAAISIKGGGRLDTPGPFLISLPYAISSPEMPEVQDVLYVDMTDVSDAAIREIVRTYKNHLTGEELDGNEKLESLRLDLLEWVLAIEEHIGFATTAYAKLRDAFP